VVDFIRKRFGYRKVGHAGTLDPMASGLLIVLLGRFTKKSTHFLNYDKEYEARLFLGASTDTGDAEGNIIQGKDAPGCALNIENIENVLKFFRGPVRQVPPMYSAKKIKGRKLYELARKGIVVEREPKEVFIEKLEIKEVNLPCVTFVVKCSKGTYIRQLAHDIGERIGCGAHLVFLKRTKIGPFNLLDAVPLDRLRAQRNILHESILQPE
ncbi:MAG: tRNA pseudouridine(55) synthase TruB, partial [Candidatus Omnitrophota bacterium]